MDIKELEQLVLKYPNNQELGMVIRMKYYEMKKANESQQMINNQLNLFNGSQQVNS
jgi:hypothetical protein